MNMTETVNIHPFKFLTHGEQLLIIRQHESRITTNSIANQLNTTESAAEKVLDFLERVEKVSKRRYVRNNLTLEDKQLVLHYIDKEKLRKKASELKAHPRTMPVYRKSERC